MLAVGVRGRAAAEWNYVDLVGRLYDLKRLAVPPAAGEKTGSATSGDRASRYDAEHDRYVDWYANNDGSGFVRREGENIVAAELEGPGVIWRIWSAQPESGLIRFYIDGATEPAMELPFNKLFNPSTGPFPFRELVREQARGMNCFVPIPYRKSCKVVLCKGWGNYYQFTYSTFPAGTKVPSFRGSFDEAEKAALAAANRAWAQRYLPTPGPEGDRIEKTITVPPGQTVEVAKFSSARAICGIVCSVKETEAANMERALREMTLSIAWDGEDSPSVWSPLGDFFGSAPGYNPYRSLASGMTRDGMYASWFMPFEKAVLRLGNDGDKPRTVKLGVIHEPLGRPAASLLRFHAKWHRDHWGRGGVGRYAKDRWPDWPILKTSGGAGRFCGVHLHIWNPLHCWDKDLISRYRRNVSELCPVPDWFQKNVMPDYWWGEGDEKFFVDGEKHPSTYGTGSEDYFGYAWGTPKFFDSATQCQTRNYANTGHLSIMRTHFADDVPFQGAFEACIEKYHGANWPLLYAATAYWYQAPGAADEYAAVPVTERVDYYTLPEILPPQPRVFAPGFFECEELKVLSHTPEIFVGPQDMSPWGADRWSGGAHLVVKSPKIGDFVELEVPAPDDKPRRLVVTATGAPDFGILSFTVNGEAIATTLDCYTPEVSPPQPAKLGLFPSRNGVFVVRVQVTGTNPKTSGPRTFFGIDAIGFEQ